MLSAFIDFHRDEIIARAKARVAARSSFKRTPLELGNGVPVFLDQLSAALKRARSTPVVDHRELEASASRHGRDLLRQGLTIGQVVHHYGDVCQTVTELAVECAEPISGSDFRMLNLCLDDAIAEAVTAFAQHQERGAARQETERLGFLAHELRNLLNTAVLAYDSLRDGRVAIGGSTGMILGRSLMGLRDLIDRALTDVRLDAGLQRLESIPVVELVEEVEIAAVMHANARNVAFEVRDLSAGASIHGDRQVLVAALANLLHNAFKFTPSSGHVLLSVHPIGDRMVFDIEDQCGGLPAGNTEKLFKTFAQAGTDRSGVGLGLAICRKAALAHGGNIHVRDLPGKGCVFTLELPLR
jgi:signal transduction histidine kinase